MAVDLVNLERSWGSYNILSEYTDSGAETNTGTQGYDNMHLLETRLLFHRVIPWDIEQILMSCAKKTEQIQKIDKRLIVGPVVAFVAYIFDNNSALSF